MIRERVGIDEVVAIARRSIRDQLPTIEPGQRSFFTIEVRDIGEVAALLEHETVARDVVDPRQRHLRPAANSPSAPHATCHAAVSNRACHRLACGR